MRTWNLGEVCDHGRLGRSCPICERDDGIEELRAEVERLTEERDRYKQALERIEVLTCLEWDRAVGIACAALEVKP